MFILYIFRFNYFFDWKLVIVRIVWCCGLLYVCIFGCVRKIGNSVIGCKGFIGLIL